MRVLNFILSYFGLTTVELKKLNYLQEESARLLNLESKIPELKSKFFTIGQQHMQVRIAKEIIQKSKEYRIWSVGERLSKDVLAINSSNIDNVFPYVE